MSLLGPRAPLTYHPWPLEEYTEEQRHMFDVRPGFSGWAQVNGRKEVEWHHNADILINIGNLIKNQLGSKIVDYIGTGKPIINICQFASCPTIHVLEKYPYKLNLHASNLSSSTTTDILKAFLQNVVGKKVPWPEIADLYVEYTPEFVANAFIEAIEK